MTAKEKLFIKLHDYVQASHGVVKAGKYACKISRLETFIYTTSTPSAHEEVAQIIGLNRTNDQLVDLLKASGWEILEPSEVRTLAVPPGMEGGGK